MPAGVVAVIVVELVLLTPVAATPPIVTPSEPPETKFVPTIVTGVPPAFGPEFGVMLVNVGGVAYVYAADTLTVPPSPLVIFTYLAPAVPAGVVAAI
jgi:hypothetical protein